MDILEEIHTLQRKYDNPENKAALTDFLLFFNRYNKHLQDTVKSEVKRLKKERNLNK